MADLSRYWATTLKGSFQPLFTDTVSIHQEIVKMTTTQSSNQHEQTAGFDRSYETLRQRFEEVPGLQLSQDDERSLKQLGWLRAKQAGEQHRLQVRLNGLAEVIASGRTLSPDEQTEHATLIDLLTTDQLTESEQQQLNRLHSWIGKKAERYEETTRLELQQAPPAHQCFERFESAKAELADLNSPEQPKAPRQFSVIALEEAQLIVSRLLGKNYALRTFFEQCVVLRYTSESDAQRANHPRPGEIQGSGGASVKRESINGTLKFVITVDDATFLRRVSWNDRAGHEHSYLKPDFISGAFTIARAVITSAIDDHQLANFAKVTKDYPPARPPFPERLLKQSPTQTVATEPGSPIDQQRDFLALYLIDPAQAEAINASWASAAKILLDAVTPATARTLAGDGALAVPPATLNRDYLYRTYDLTRQDANLAGTLGNQLANSRLGFIGRLGLGGAAGWWFGGPVGAAVGGAVGGAARAPLSFFRTLQGIFQERYDFYYELGVAESDKKEVARILDRQEGISDRDKRLKDLLVSGDEDGMRRLLLCDSASGDYNIWRVQLYLFHFDRLFRKTGGKEVSRTSYNFITRLARDSNKARRIGTKAGLYEHVVEGGHHRYKLKTWDRYAENVYQEWADRSEREAMSATPETFQMMSDTNGFINLEDEYGHNLNDPNSRGWQVAQTGDLRLLLGESTAREFLGFLQNGDGQGWQGDARFRRKFNANEIAAIQRMRTFRPGSFPNEHTQENAKAAFEHFDRSVEARGESIHSDDEDALTTIEQRTVASLMADDEITATTFKQLAQQVMSNSYDRPFGGRDDVEGRKSFPRITGRGLLAKELKRSREDLEREFPSDNTSALRNALNRLVTLTEYELTGDWPPELTDHESANESAALAVRRIIDDAHTSEAERFTAHRWLTQLRHTAPRVTLLAQFRADLVAETKPYATALAQALASDPVSNSVSDILKSYEQQLKTLRALPPDTPVSDAVRQQLRDRIATLDAARSPELPALAASLDGVTTVGSTVRVAEQLVSELKQWFTRYQAKRPTATTQYEAINRLADQLSQAIQEAQAGISQSADEQARDHRQRLASFRSLSCLPERDKVPAFTDAELYRRLKVASLAMAWEAARTAKQKPEPIAKPAKKPVEESDDS